jgi:hypothetical protein
LPTILLSGKDGLVVKKLLALLLVVGLIVVASGCPGGATSAAKPATPATNPR